MQSFVISFKKIRSVFIIYLLSTFAYRATAVIWILADSQLALIMPAVWLAGIGGIENAGFNAESLVSYYLISLVISQFIVCHLLWDIGFEIREGEFTAHLLRPVSYILASAARNLSWRVGKIVLFLPILAFYILVYHQYLGQTLLHINLISLITIFLAHILSFLIAYSLAMVAMWTTEFYSLFQLYYFPELLLSGRLLPLSAMPDWVSTLTSWLPFQYTIWFPANVILGRANSSEITHGILMQCIYIIIGIIVARTMFIAGIKRYTGFGN